MVDFTPVLDKYGIPLHFNDAGDSGANIGRISLYYLMTNQKLKAKMFFRKAFASIWYAGFVRHPEQWPEKDTMTSDQTELLLLAAIALGEKDSELKIRSKMKYKGLMYPNGKDPFRPHHLVFWFKWAGFLCYMFAKLRVVIWKLKPLDKYKKPDVTDDVNFYFILRWMKFNKNYWAKKCFELYNPIKDGPNGKSALHAYFHGDSKLSRLMWNAIRELGT